MIKTLQKKFTVTAMIAITVLLVVLLGAINLANALSLSRQSERLLESLLVEESLGSMGPAENEPTGLEQRPIEEHRERRGFFEQPLTDDSRMAAVYFSVRLDAEGEATVVNTGRIASVSAAEAAALATQVPQESERGRLEQFRYCQHRTPDGGRLLVFLDTSTQRYSILRIAALSGLAGLAAWCAMLALVMGLSKRAIRPIAENMERQRQFVTDAGHELKTPVAIIQANAEAMELMGGESKYSRNIRTQVRRLTDLTQNLLTLARIDEASVPVDLADFTLSPLLTESVDMFRAPAELKKLRVTTEIAGDVTVKANREQIKQLFSILLDNAVKYCPEGGTLSVSLCKEDKSVLRIANTAADQSADPARFFDRFYRADSSRNQKSGGYGIGLSAAQAIVRLHKGEIRAAYEGDCIVFTVRI